MQISLRPVLVRGLFVLWSMSAFDTFARTEQRNGVRWEYETLKGGARIVAVPNGTSGKVAVPTKLGGYWVFEIYGDPYGRPYYKGDRFAFKNCSRITSITLPEQIIGLGPAVFHECTSLREVVFLGRKPYFGRSYYGYGTFANLPSSCIVYVPTKMGWDDYYTIPGTIQGLRLRYIPTYTISFVKNGGKGSMPKQTLKFNKAAKLRKNTFKRTGYVFMGWSLSKYGEVALKNAQKVKGICATGHTLKLYAKWAKKNYKIQFLPNGGTGKMPAQKMVYGKAAKLTACKFTRKGYNFAGWSKTPKGSVIFKDKQKVSNLNQKGENIKLYAIWAPVYTVNFNANGGTGAMAKQSFTYGTSGQLSNCSFKREGYVFQGWATSKMGHVSYSDRQVIKNLLSTSGATLTLYAIWLPINYSIQYDANGGTGAMAKQSFTYDISGQLSNCSFRRDGYVFQGWATSKTGNVSYRNQQVAKNLVSTGGAVLKLYAIWSPISYTIQFDGNGGTGAMANQSFTYDISGQLSNCSFRRDGYVFQGWATSKTGNVSYCNQQVVKNLVPTGGAVLKLYAIWSPISYTIQFDANGGEGTMASQTAQYDEGLALTRNAFSWTNHVFYGWATNSMGSAVFKDSDNVINLCSVDKGIVTLYAVWDGPREYLVVDLLSKGANNRYDITMMDEPPPSGFNEDEYKTTKMVLRRIMPGTFTMGSPTNAIGHSERETQHEVTITRQFYIGIYEVTQKQWELVMGTTPSSYVGDMRPVGNISYDDIRGSGKDAMWPFSDSVDNGSFMGRMREKTSLHFDLPTEAQWEYACRAGTTTDLNSGKNMDNTRQDTNMNEVGRYGYNNGYYGGIKDNRGGYSDYHTTVGSYSPNLWGLYDMHGNVSEWCLDGWQANLGASAVVDPSGVINGSRVWRGGDYRCEAQECKSDSRSNLNSNARNNWLGFRAIFSF